MEARMPRPARLFVVFSLALATVATLVFASGQLPEGAPPAVMNLPYTVPRFLAALATVLLVVHMRGEERRAWWLIAIGTVIAALADVIYDFYDVVLGTELPAAADTLTQILWLAPYGFWMAGVISFPYSKGSRFAQLRLLIDGAAGAVSLGLVAWRAYLVDVITLDGSSLFENFMTAAYPLSDVVLLVALVLLSVRRTPYRLHRPLILLTLSFLVTAVADVLYLLELTTYEDGKWYDGMWVAGVALITLAAWSTTRPVRAREYPDQRASARQLVVPYALVGGLMVLTFGQVLLGQVDSMTKTLLLGAGLVAALVIGRQTVALREHKELVERERRDLVSSISHELRTPLTAMTGFARILADDWRSFPDESRDELLGSIADQTEYLSRIVTDLIEISRDNLEQVRLHSSTGSMAATVAKAVNLADLEGHAGLTVEVDPGLGVLADHARLTQILVNLLTNAARYGRGRIHVVASTDGDTLLVEVHDDGSGVPIRYRELIWDRFERGAHRYDATVGGTGLGLPIARALAVAHNGTLTYRDSDLFGGACFTLALPARAQAARPAMVH
jgi:signal transduction histidine kinase